MASSDLLLGLLGTLADMLGYEFQPKRPSVDASLASEIHNLDTDVLHQDALRVRAHLLAYTDEWRRLITTSQTFTMRTHLLDEGLPESIKHLIARQRAISAELERRQQADVFVNLYVPFYRWTETPEAADAVSAKLAELRAESQVSQP